MGAPKKSSNLAWAVKLPSGKIDPFTVSENRAYAERLRTARAKVVRVRIEEITFKKNP